MADTKQILDRLDTLEKRFDNLEELLVKVATEIVKATGEMTVKLSTQISRIKDDIAYDRTKSNSFYSSIADDDDDDDDDD